MTKFKETEIGKIPEDWAVRELGEIAGFQYGLGERAKETGEYVYLRITDITSDGFLNKTGLTFIGKDRVKKEWILKKNDVLVARTGASFGKTYLFDKEFKATYGGFLIRLLFKENIIGSNFFFQFSRSSLYWNQANNLVNGGAQPQFNANTISKLLVPCPPLHEQHAISKILSNLDAKIELNREMNATLESMAEALFKHWFVDFEFPDENGKPYKSSGGKMADSELGEIPEGLDVETLGNIAEVGSGKRPTQKVDTRSDTFSVELLGASSVMGYVQEALYSEPIIVTGRVGTHGIVQRITNPSWPSDNTLVIKPKFYEYVFQCLKQIDYNSLNIGSTQPLITQTQIKNQVVLIPEKNTLDSFERLVSKLYSKVTLNKDEIDYLELIRDSLLPRLMSGKIRVPVEVMA